jgi:DNA-binding CsgD family transcriptional regulator
MVEKAVSLTRREAEVVALLARGKTTKEIATALQLSTDTVADHRKRICRKVNLHSTASLVAFALSISPPEKGD